MYDIKTILCAIVLSENADRILGRALREAQVHDAKVYILHVLPAVSDIMTVPVASLMGKEKFEQLIKEHKEEIEATIRKKIEALKETVITGDAAGSGERFVDVLVVEGDPVIEILDAGIRLEADMLVMGTHAKGLTEHTFMGDVAHKVLKRARVPVLSVPAYQPRS